MKNQMIETEINYDYINALVEILQQMDNCDLLGRSVEFKAVIINRLELEINKI